MTRKDYELIAESIQESREELSHTTDIARWHFASELVADRLAYALERDNPRFDRSKFLQACGIRTEISEDRLGELLDKEDNGGYLSDKDYREKARLIKLEP